MLAVAHFQGLPHIVQLWIAFRTVKDFRYIPIHEIASALYAQMAKGLLFFHAFTACHVTSYSTNHRKKSVWKATGTMIRGQLYCYAQCHWKGPVMQPSSLNWICLPPERNVYITNFSVTTDTVSDICLSWKNACLIMWRPSWIPIWRPNDGNFDIL